MKLHGTTTSSSMVLSRICWLASLGGYSNAIS